MPAPVPSTSHKNWAPLFLHWGKFHLLFQEKQLNMAVLPVNVYTVWGMRRFNSYKWNTVRDPGSFDGFATSNRVQLLNTTLSCEKPEGQPLGWHCADHIGRVSTVCRGSPFRNKQAKMGFLTPPFVGLIKLCPILYHRCPFKKGK